MSKKKNRGLDDDDILAFVDDARKDTRYQVTDYPVELLTSKFREKPEDVGDIYIPAYQRTLRWTPVQKSYFIESVLIRIPIPPIFLYEVKGALEVVDGSQRIRTLAQFVNDEFELVDLEKLDALNGFRFSEMPSSIRKRLFNTSIRSFVLDEGTDQSTRIEMFRRLNTTGKKLHDAEIRKGAYQGPFLDLILRCASLSVFERLTPRISRSSAATSERQELVTRFFIYSDHYKQFTHDVQKFLDRYLIMGNTKFRSDDFHRMELEFNTTMEFIDKYYPNAFYRLEKNAVLPRVRFEAVAVGTCLALREGRVRTRQKFDWLWGTEIDELVRTDASNSGPRLRARIEFVRDRLMARNDAN